jgi:phage terminase large subunit-like protein
VVFIYTPPSLHSRSYSKADDPQHAAKMYRAAAEDVSGRWQTFHWTSRENGYISQAALGEICHDMTALAIRMEIDAEDVDEAPGALWHRDGIEKTRVKVVPGDLHRIVVGVDPSISSTGDAAGIVTCGIIGNSHSGHAYVLDDDTIQGSPHQWASRAIGAYRRWNADRIVAESNQGGLMVSQTICTIDPHVPVTLVHASRGKATRAEPVAAAYESGRVHHVGSHAALEDEMVLWTPGDPKSPNRLDAMVYSLTDLLLPENLLTGGQIKVVGY